ncbi:MAG: xanthine dehydrogenase molybdopterin binding subunit [Halobacteriovoraceae bacterium]|nr:xanthine dehydrogenase molybdopterin binding subunit [Halobacteriovoraceae bacterium]|tara:strand:+ start:15863 stop:18187 length:2325 start_codon:yes stop_codon:yes gene_type:complete
MIGKNVRHDSGVSHVSGESIFIDDREALGSEVFVGILTSPVAHGVLKSIQSEKALAHPNCLAVYTADDFVQKKWGTIVHEQPFLVIDKISYMDEAVAIFVTDNRYKIEEIKELFTLEIDELPAVFSIDEARQKNMIIYQAPTPFERGNVDEILKTAPHTLAGRFRCGGQEQFYMESQAAVVYPLEEDQMEVHSSSQHPSETQRVVAEALGLPFHKVTCIVKRMGGGFGGKESQAAPIAAYAAVAASKLKRPARCILTKDEDMKITGKRHPFENDYEVAFDDQGKILALKCDLKSDGGAYADLSSSILERGMFHLDNAYYLENCKITGTCYRTHTHPNTAFRGFGGPQGAMTIESIMEDIAVHLGIDSYDVRRINLYEGDNVLTPYNQKLENNLLPELFDGLYKQSDYAQRREKIKKFNAQKNGKVRGLSMSGTKFGIAFTARFLNQGNALVNLHLDGTAQVSTGATEMGQGVNAKIAQIVAHAFGLDYLDVKVMPTSTEKNHNTSPTAASSGSDINGAAALAACNKIKSRLTSLAKLMFEGIKSDDLNEYEIKKGELDSDIEFKDKKVKKLSSGQTMSLVELLSAAYLNRISLGDYAHFKTPALGFSKEIVQGKAFNYFTQGAAVSEVEVDEYTGELKVLRSDIYMDLGRPINPGIDKGQVTGAFIQSMGWVTTENLVYSDKGHLLTYSPTTYKIPNIHDTPREFNVAFISNDDNDCNVHRSKAVGEPPFLLGISVWTAVKNALSYRSQSKLINIISPATNEVIINELTKVKSP